MFSNRSEFHKTARNEYVYVPKKYDFVKNAIETGRMPVKNILAMTKRIYYK